MASWWTLPRRVLAGIGMAAWAVSAAAVFSIEGHVIAAGAPPLTSPCFRLQATVAEPVAGYSASATYSITAGFQALPAGTTDSLFRSGFEACPR